ncbi:Regulator of rDNA transcription protein 15 [Abeliophyllum distichum]|uniref:Regulator of rDNA transcription protein 15 n=1 Tax=Abeliophyllum distichum TaxID=126358 RepID=A0ABD1NQC9_9LAMI
MGSKHPIKATQPCTTTRKLRSSTTNCRDMRRCRIKFRPAAHEGAREANIQPNTPRIPLERRWRATRCVTPRQTCPQHNGFGRNLRSKTRWFTGFCNSHQVSHFAAFFIDARAEISVAESRFKLETRLVPRSTPRTGASQDWQCCRVFLGAFCAGVR